MSILITGGMGSLGQYLTKKLINENLNKKIILFDLRANDSFLKTHGNKIEFVEGNINYFSDLTSVIKRYEIDEIFHLAAGLSSKINENPYFGFKINLEGTINILEMARLYEMKKVIFISSISTFGTNVVEPVKNDARQFPTNLYGITKVACELWGLYYYQNYGIDFRALRFPRLVNPGRYEKGASSYPSLMIEKAIKSEPYQINYDKEFRVPIIYIKDAIDALMLLYYSKQGKGKIFNINGLIPTAQEIVEEILKQFPNAPLSFNKYPIKSLLSIPLDYDDSEAKKYLGWKSTYDLKKLISSFNEELQRLE
jgi:threonine 3-dehydrogenase